MYKSAQQGWLKHLDFIILDAICAQLAFVLSYGWRFGWPVKWLSWLTSNITTTGSRWLYGEIIDGVSVAANVNTAAQYICREWIDEVYIAAADTNKTPNKLIDQCRQMGVTIHLQMVTLGSGKQTVEKIAGMAVVTNSINIATPGQLMLKRAMDVLGGLALSIAALIAIVFVGPVIKRKSPGPILYKQERIGQNGKKFKMYKIRSMNMDADARKQELMDQNRVSDGMMFKLDFDPRIIGNEILPDGTRKTGIGEFIRKTSIDELPQGFNILMGQMTRTDL